ncbi:MAG: 8-amino-7-oxononanoate synthase [Zoogloea sp.]|nr:8-amino-7-oxononanoate synthase [Zoogloea sp.]MDD3353657.1 8-amino-7-oxononanoate synthase [Zoogloea sp.]
MDPLEELQQGLADLDAAGLRRHRRVVTTPCQPETRLAGRDSPVIAFCSNDYLGLAAEPAIAAALRAGSERWGSGAGASHLVSGHYAPHEALEARLAAFVGMDDALYFSTGYMANIGVMPALVGRGDAIFADRVNHASLVDGALLSRAELIRYAHCDLAALESRLQASRAPRKLIVTDGVFSMDGDIAPLREMLALAERHKAWLLVDDAHGFGVLGPQGRGCLAHFGIQSPRLIYMGTLGKAAGVTGAFVAGQREVIDWLLNRSRSYIFTTGAPPLIAEGLLAALDMIEQGDARRSHLLHLITRFKAALHLTRWQRLPSDTPIQPIVIGDNHEALAVSRALDEAGLWVPAIRPPTVPKGSARLRIVLSAAHTEAQVAHLVTTLMKLERRQP